MTNDAEHFAPGISQNPSTFEDVWRRLPRLGRLALWLVAIAVVYQIAASLFSGITGSANSLTGQGSSFDTTSSGTAAFARLLTLNGHRVDRLTTSLSPKPDTHSAISSPWTLRVGVRPIPAPSRRSWLTATP